MKRAVAAVASLSTSETRAPASPLVPCWSCKGPVQGCALFCDVCGAVQAPGANDHFSRLGLPVDYDVPADQLDHQYFGLQRRMHPDRFAARSPKEKALSQAQATALNDAYETLRDPVKRAVYLLDHLGHAEAKADPSLLMEQMELREALAEAHDLPGVTALLAQADALVGQCRQELAVAFDRDDFAAAARVVVRLKFLTKLAEDAKIRKSRFIRLP